MSRNYQYRFEKGESTHFHYADYIVFGCIIGICAIVGLYHAIKDKRKKKSTDTTEYMLAGRKMALLPVALSMLGSFVSANTLLGTPAEMYNNNTMYWWVSLAVLFSIIGASQIFLPVFYNLQIISVYQYIEMRFGHISRLISSALYMLWMTTYMAIVLYGPSLALNAVTGLSLWGSICAVGGVCIFYTTLGGMKSVVWTDTFQVLIMFAGMLTLLIEGSSRVGGFSKAWEIAAANQRIQFTDFNPDPTSRHTFWTLSIGGSFLWCAVYGINQAQIQRAMSIPTLWKAKVAMALNVPFMVVILSLVCSVGVVMYAYYATCDPVRFKIINKSDQLLPLFTMDLLGDLHGLPGLILSCIFSGSLSTISSGLNALAAVLLEDFVRPFCCPKMSDLAASIFSKVAVVLSGLICLLFAYIVSEAGSILQVSLSLWGIIGGPMLGLFCLGMLFPWCNKWGAIVGQLLSLGVMAWIGYGSLFEKVSGVKPPSKSISGCYDFMTTVSYNTTETTAATSITDTTLSVTTTTTGSTVFPLYQLSYLWYTGLGTLITVVIGMFVSLITGHTDTSTLDPKLICPFFDVFMPCLPQSWLNFLHFGVPHSGKNLHDPQDDPIADPVICLEIKNLNEEPVVIINKENNINKI